MRGLRGLSICDRDYRGPRSPPCLRASVVSCSRYGPKVLQECWLSSRGKQTVCLMSTARKEPSPGPLLLCYITDRKQFPGESEGQQLRMLEQISECAAAGVDFVQLREKDLSARALEELARKAVAAIPTGSATKLLINSRTDVALACGAHGVHLPARDLPASEVRAVWDRAGLTRAVIGVSTHSPEEVA